MVKRDQIQRILLILGEDDEGGTPVEKEALEVIPANVSISAIAGIVDGAGLVRYQQLTTTTDYKLDENYLARYKFQDKLYRVVQQIKMGNEWFSTLMETAEQEGIC